LAFKVTPGLPDASGIWDNLVSAATTASILSDSLFCDGPDVESTQEGNPKEKKKKQVVWMRCLQLDVVLPA
jgi:hypothetical protein